MKIIIVKFAALGDVLRTTPLLSALKEKYPDSHISWLTEKASAGILENNELINMLYVYDKEDTAKEFEGIEFDLLINLDKDFEAIHSAEMINAKVKKGFGHNEDGSLKSFNADSEYAYRLGIDDELKFKKNKKTYQQISFEQVGLEYAGQEYIFHLREEDVECIYQKLVKTEIRPEAKKIGIVTGKGSGFCGKSLPEEYYTEIIDSLNGMENMQVLLLGGPNEAEKNRRISEAIKSKVIDTGCDNSIGEYAAIIDLCDIVITGDTLTLHLAVANKKKVIAFFGSTSAAEIDLYGRGKKILPEIDCAPCYKQKCPIDEACMKEFTPEKIIAELKKLAGV